MTLRHSSLFSQLLGVIDRGLFARLVRGTGAEKAAKGFSCWDQLVAMLFCQLAQARSLREITGGLQCCEGKLRHLGLENAPGRSTLSYANAHRPWQLFEQLFYCLLETCRAVAPGKKFRFKNKLLSLDATVIDLCASMFDWAKFRQTKGAVKLHLLLDHDGCLPSYALISEGTTADVTVAQELSFPKGSVVVIDRGYNDYAMFERWCRDEVFFVTRLKENASYVVTQRRAVPQKSAILADEWIEFQVFQAGRKVVHTYRRIELWVEEKGQSLVLLTNHLQFGATTIAAIYKERWQIELFFKALKQNLKVKTFVGTSANAVRIQIWTALIAMLMLKYLQFRSVLSWALSNLVALLRWNLFTYRNLWQWLDKPFETPPEMPPDPQLVFI
jgi:transposase